MHAIRPRVNTLSTHVMSMLMVIVAVGSLVSFGQLNWAKPEVNLGLNKINFIRKNKLDHCDQAYVSIDLKADFTKMWTWNINRMYVYVVAEYSTPRHPRNEVVIWDAILNGRSEALVNRIKQRNKYSLKDHGYDLRGRDVTLKFKYNIMPYMGPLMYGEVGDYEFTLPTEYTPKK